MNSTMKMTFLMFAALWLSLSGCQKSDSNSGQPQGNGGVIATTPEPECNTPGNPNCTGYNQSPVGYSNPYVYQGSPWVVPQTWGYYQQRGYCGCPQGYMPTMSPYMGFACYPIQQYRQVYGSYSTMYFQPQNGHVLNFPQETYNSPTRQYQPPTQANWYCNQNAGLSCDTRNSNSCPNNATCQPHSGGSTIGLCVFNNQNQPNSQQPGCQETKTNWGYVYSCSWSSYYNTFPGIILF